MLKLVNDYPTLSNQSANTKVPIYLPLIISVCLIYEIKKLVDSLFSRFKQSIGQDVFVPIYSKQ